MRTLNLPGNLGWRMRDGVVSFLGPWMIASLWGDQKEVQAEQNGKMSFLDHLDELRRRLIVSLVALTVAFFRLLGFSREDLRLSDGSHHTVHGRREAQVCHSN